MKPPGTYGRLLLRAGAAFLVTDLHRSDGRIVGRVCETTSRAFEGNQRVSEQGESDHASTRRLVLLVCLAQTLVQIGGFFWPALLPQLAPQWTLSNSAAGWITAAFYGAYR